MGTPTFHWHWPWRHHRRHHHQEHEEDGEGEEELQASPTPNDRNPVLLIPGIAGSILNAVSSKGAKERIWVRLYVPDQEFRAKLWSFFNPDTGKAESLDADTHIEVPEDNYGLYSIDLLDPDLIVGRGLVGYYHALILRMRTWGYKDGETLFGFGYDFRQSNQLPETMGKLLQKLRAIHQQTGRKVDVITHSMGGLLFRSFVALHCQDVEQLVDKWITIATPFHGAPGFITDALLTGVEFLRGWEGSMFVSKWSMHQLLMACPSIYELMANYSFPWEEAPQLRIVHKAGGGDSSSSSSKEGGGGEDIKEETFGDMQSVLAAMDRVLKDNSVKVKDKNIPLPLNQDIVQLAHETREIWRTARLPASVKFFNVYGTQLCTPFHSQYGSKEAPLADLNDIIHSEAIFECKDGDGTVPVESSKGDGFDPVFRIGVPGEHRGLLNDPRVHRMVAFFLQAPPHDTWYDPYTDAILVPSRDEIEAEMGTVRTLHYLQPRLVSKKACLPAPTAAALGCDAQEDGLVVDEVDEETVEISVMPEKMPRKAERPVYRS